MTMRLSDFEALTFDVYGTLVDWEPGIVSFLEKWAQSRAVSATGKDLLMAFDRARAEIQTERPAHLYPEVLRRCFDCIAKEFGVQAEASEREEFASAPHRWPPYSDSHASLKALQAHVKIGALSNIDEASLAITCRKLDFIFDVIVTAERVGAYKPDWPHFNTGIADLAKLGIPPERILHVGQSLRADVTPANKLGVKCAWVNRGNRLLGLYGEGAAEAKPDLTVSSMKELVDALTAG